MNWVAKQILRIYIASILIITTPTESMYIYWNVDEKEKKREENEKAPQRPYWIDCLNWNKRTKKKEKKNLKKVKTKKT